MSKKKSKFNIKAGKTEGILTGLTLWEFLLPLNFSSSRVRLKTKHCKIFEFFLR